MIDNDKHSLRVVQDAVLMADLGDFIPFRNGVKGLASCFELKPSLLLLSCDPQRLSGEEIIVMLRASTQFASLPIIWVADPQKTQYKDVDAFQLGADSFLSKPFTGSEATAKIMSVLGIRRHGDTSHPGMQKNAGPDSGSFVANLLDMELSRSERNNLVHTTSSNEVIPTKFQGYELITKIGEGSLGIVYEARQVSLDRIVALRLLMKTRLEARLATARFRREIKTMAQLSHRNLIQVIDAGETSQVCYVAMEFVDGITLSELIQDGALEVGQFTVIMTQVCNALQYLHEQGIVHQELKPGNIFITDDGTIKVGDFGLTMSHWPFSPGASDARSGIEDHDPYQYQAPELTRGSDSTVLADIYSLSRVLTKLLVPSTQDFNCEECEKMRPDIPAQVWNILKCSGSDNPSSRLPSAREFKTVLSEALGRITS